MSARPVVTLADLSNFKGHTFGGKASKGEQGPVCHSSFRFSGCRPVVRQRRSAHILDLPVEELLVLASLTSLTSLWLEDPETEGYKNDPTVLGGCLSALHNLQHVRLAATVMPRLQSLTNLE
ncbi:hypothetical protein WJX72_001778 [[Myrmecia] bisecta]|uniref:Wingless n=1 Tax=[Myrmecia] bisecta TaxID=41462 RepID=A0AAW1R4T7_9CHLO